MPCATGNIPARLCTVEEAVEGIVLGAGHPAMTVTNVGSTFAFNGTTQVLNVPVIPAAPATPDADVQVMADASARAAATPDFIGQVGVQVTDATNGNYSLWVGYTVAPGGWTLKAGTLAAQNSTAVSITGGTVTGITDLAVSDGGTGASTAPAARVNLRNPSLPLTANDLDWSLSDNFYVTLTAPIAVTFSNAQDGQRIDFVVVADPALSMAITWPAAVKWPASVVSTLVANGSTGVFTFKKINGLIYGDVVIDYVT